MSLTPWDFLEDCPEKEIKVTDDKSKTLAERLRELAACENMPKNIMIEAADEIDYLNRQYANEISGHATSPFFKQMRRENESLRSEIAALRDGCEEYERTGNIDAPYRALRNGNRIRDEREPKGPIDTKD